VWEGAAPSGGGLRGARRDAAARGLLQWGKQKQMGTWLFFFFLVNFL